MPELPEVELVANSLQKLIPGRTIVRAELLRPLLSPDRTAKQFDAALRRRRISQVSRRGKYVVISFDDQGVLLTHLRMSGRFGYLEPDSPLPKFTHAIFHFENEKRLVFSDQRHFGYMKLIEARDLETAPEILKLGLEPLSNDFTESALVMILAKSKRSIKETLLDQTRLVGLGNIYVAEALFRAGVRPTTESNRLSKRRSSRLRQAIVDVLNESIVDGSTLNIDPENIDGSYYGGSFEQEWQVYDREGLPCQICGSLIRRIVQGGRSTYFCPRCQRQ